VGGVADSRQRQPPARVKTRGLEGSPQERGTPASSPSPCAIPRAHLPYGEKGQKVNAFAFERRPPAPSTTASSGATAAYAMGVTSPAPSRVGVDGADPWQESGGEVQNLPWYTFETSDGDVDAKCPTRSIDQRREAELSNNGLMPLVWWKGEPTPRSSRARPCRAGEGSTSEANSNEKLGTRLPYIFACSRFAHFLKKMCYDKIGSIKREGEDWSSANGVQNTLQK